MEPRRRLVAALSSIDWGRLRVAAVVVHGSALWSPRPRDVDVMVVPGEGFRLEDEVRVMEAVEEATGLPADIHVVDLGDPDCFLVEEALSHGEIVYLHPRVGAGLLARLALVCWDYMTMRRRLGYTRTLLRRAESLGGP